MYNVITVKDYADRSWALDAKRSNDHGQGLWFVAYIVLVIVASSDLVERLL